MSYRFSFFWPELDKGYSYSCVCGNRFRSERGFLTCLNCGREFLYVSEQSGARVSVSIVRDHGEKITVGVSVLRYGLGRRKDGSGYVYFRERLSDGWYSINLAKRRVYYVWDDKVRLENDLFRLPVDAHRELWRMAEERLTQAGYRLELAPYAHMDGLGEIAVGCMMHPPLALLQPISPAVLVKVAMKLVARQVKITATDPVGMLSEAYGVRFGKSVLQYARTLPFPIPGRHLELKGFAELYRHFGPDMARWTAGQINEILKGGSFIQSDHVVALVPHFARHAPSAKVGAKRLVETVRLNGGVLWMMVDSMRMMDQMGMDIDMTVMRAQDEIKRLHDRLVSLFRTHLREQRKKAKAKQIKRLHKYEWSDDRYAIVAPKTAGEIVEEGEAMRHCVGSYVDAVVKGKTDIVFLRTIDGKRVATLEVRNGRLFQCFGPRNSPIGGEAAEFVKAWADELGIDYRFCNGLTIVDAQA